MWWWSWCTCTAMQFRSSPLRTVPLCSATLVFKHLHFITFQVTKSYVAEISWYCFCLIVQCCLLDKWPHFKLIAQYELIVWYYRSYANILKRSTLKESCTIYQSYAAIISNKGFMSLANYLTTDYDNDGNADNANETDDSNDDNDDAWSLTLPDSGRESTLGSTFNSLHDNVSTYLGMLACLLTIDHLQDMWWLHFQPAYVRLHKRTSLDSLQLGYLVRWGSRTCHCEELLDLDTQIL